MALKFTNIIFRKHVQNSLLSYIFLIRKWSHQTTKLTNKPCFGFLFDIDGVIVRGKKLLPSAKEAFKLLTDEYGKFIVPALFVTNAGNMLRQEKAKQLSNWLDVQVQPDQVVMSHSPLKMFRQFHDKHVLVSGQGPVLEIAKNLGFTKITTIETLRQTFPLLDMVDHKRRQMSPCAFEKYFPKIEAVILFGEPVRWETNLQLIIDVLLSDGLPNHAPREIPYPHLPVLACNMDLLWMAEACIPRFGHGCFMHCLECLYQKVTGRELKYTALIGKPSEITYHHADYLLSLQAQSIGINGVQTIYCIGDNPETDIYGGNLYNRYLHSRCAKQKKQAKQVQQLANTTKSSINSDTSSVDELMDSDDTMIDLMSSGTDESFIITDKSVSILVCTGVYTTDSDFVTYGGKEISNHNHRDFVLDSDLKNPNYVTQNVLEAVKLVFEKENYH
ncbi:haloacid dehalogenase-like hydrolase domain-containing 5 [Argonauta hians]